MKRDELAKQEIKKIGWLRKDSEISKLPYKEFVLGNYLRN